jgi:hypothetical protein
MGRQGDMVKAYFLVSFFPFSLSFLFPLLLFSLSPFPSLSPLPASPYFPSQLFEYGADGGGLGALRR